MKERIGVYICHCGGNISDYVDVEQLSKLMQSEEGVVVAKNVMFACADSNQKEMIKDIREKNLDAIVVASCSPKLHLHTFRNVAERAGINPYNYVQVNIREQCSWPHSDQPLDATYKAVGLIRGGIKKAARSQALESIQIEATRAAAVIGAGVAGMRAAIDLARLDNEVFLIEKDHFVGGHVTESSSIFPTNDSGVKLVKRLYDEIKSLNKITLFTGATVEKVSGTLGNFNVELKIRPRYIAKNADRNLLKEAMESCNTIFPDESNFNLSSRKAVYKKFPESLPDVPVADPEALKNETVVLKKYSSCFDLQQEVETIHVRAGSILVTTGFDPYQPKEEEYGYQKIDGVVTLPEFTRLVELHPDKLMYHNKQVKRVAFIYCVGNRQTKGENKYCSRVCCTSAIYASLRIKEKYNHITSYHLFRDIRTYGKQEILYEKSSKQGDIYMRFDEKEPPVVSIEGKNLIVKVKDHLTSKKEMELETDLVVLVTGMVSRKDSKDLAEKLKIPIGNDKFFNEIHPKLKPVETVIKGVFIGGSCQGPKNISESVQSSLAAVAKINSLIKDGSITLDPIIARVNSEACTWCGKCAEFCEYNALHEQNFDGKTIATLNKATCKGCGICAPVCPVNAIEIVQYTDNEIESMIDGFMELIELTKTTKEEASVEETKTFGMKEFPQLWKEIEALLKQKSRSIPELATELGKDKNLVTYHLMTMNKYGFVAADGMDEKEVYYNYKMKN
jgi:heterodisulfide reductase subunit A2